MLAVLLVLAPYLFVSVVLICLVLYLKKITLLNCFILYCLIKWHSFFNLVCINYGE